MQLLQQIWNGILDLTKLLVIPDWGALIALLPVFMGVVVMESTQTLTYFFLPAS